MRKRMLVCGACGYEAQAHQFKWKRYTLIIYCPKCDEGVKMGLVLLNGSKMIWQSLMPPLAAVVA